MELWVLSGSGVEKTMTPLDAAAMAPRPVSPVLLVEDNQLLREMLLMVLPSLGGFPVVGAPDGDSGLEQCYALHPACVVIDVVMPGLNGYQLVRALRGDAETASIPLIILTALAHEQEQFAGLAAGADQYLLKPVKPQELVAAIQRAIALSEAERLRHWDVLVEQELSTAPIPSVTEEEEP
jgi:CheY-like chemotaxis protein